jgi:hypothetical protein
VTCAYCHDGTMSFWDEQAHLDQVVAECLVRISGANDGGGTGFFVAPGSVLTCAHVVEGIPEETVAVWHLGQRLTGRISGRYPSERPAGRKLYPYPDLAVISVEQAPSHGCVWLDLELPRLDDRLHCVGFSDTLKDKVPMAEPATFVFDGLHESSEGLLLKLGAGALAASGMSGAPLINLRNGRVCGIMKTTRDEYNPYGGWAVPTQAVNDYAEEIIAANKAFHAGDDTWRERFRSAIATDSSVPTARFVPPELKTILDTSPDGSAFCDSLLARYSGLLHAGSGPEARLAFGRRCRHLLRVALASAHAGAVPLMSGRDVAVLVALAAQASYCEVLPASDLARLIASDGPSRTAWIRHVEAIKKLSPRAWSDIAGSADIPKPDTDALGALTTSAMDVSGVLGVMLYRERETALLCGGTVRSGDYADMVSQFPEPFPSFRNICSAVLATLSEPAYRFTEYCGERLSGVKIVAGCRVLYLGILMRAALSMGRLMEVADDGVLTPVRSFPSADRRMRMIQRQVADVQPEDEDDAIALRLICTPENPSTLAGVRREVDLLRRVLDECTATLAQYYVSSSDSVLRLRYPRVRSTVDDPHQYVKERGLPFDPDLARLTMNAEGILPLLVRPLYGDAPEVGVRELLQNALDAVSARRAIGSGTIGYAAPTDPPQAGVTVTITDGSALLLTSSELEVPPPDDWTHWLEVHDTGIGMTSEVIREHFMAVGGSYDPLADPLHLSPSSPRSRPRSGRFGVGVLASFLLGTEVQVVTRHLSVAEHEGLHFQLTEYAEEAELRFCRVPVGTTIRVRLDEHMVERLAGNPSSWDWYQYTEPPVERGEIREENFSVFPSSLPPLDPENASDLWRKLTVSPYGSVFWTPADKSHESQIFVNGIRVAAWHHLRKNVLEPTAQLKQPVISIVDSAGACSLKLTRDGFVNDPDEVFEAVRKDATADHIAWLVLNARDGLDQPLLWESRIWHERQHTSGEGDGVVHAVPFAVTGRGIVPLHPLLLREAGVTELDLLLMGEGFTTPTETEEPRKNLRSWLPGNVSTLSDWNDAVAHHATGLLKVNMFGGFGYYPVAAGIPEAFRFARKFKPAMMLQVVITDRGSAYAKMDDRSVISASDGVLAFAEGSRSAAVDDRLLSYLNSTGDYSDADRSGRPPKEILATGYYGVLHLWLDDITGPQDEFSELWRAYRLPAVLPFGLDVDSLESPLSADLRVRIKRMSA